jgi:hypothetical protein
MDSKQKRKIQLHKLELDENYLIRKLTEMNKKLPIISQNLKLYKQKFNVRNTSKLLIHEKALIKILAINRRTLKLIIEHDLIRFMDLFGLKKYSARDVEIFLKENINKHGN